MMPPEPYNLDDAFQRILAGQVDALHPEEVARLEGLLNSSPALAERLGGQVPPVDEKLAAALRALEARAAPDASAWTRVWHALDAAAPAARHAAVGRRRPRVLRLWAPLTAAAACLLLALLWTGRGHPPAESWPLRLATDAVISELEVSGDTMAFIVSAGDVNVIWVLPTESTPS